MFKIERAMTGLFEHLKLRSLGKLPLDMNEVVSPTLDLNPWAYKANGLKTQLIIPATVVVAVGTVATFVQPKDWLVIAANVSFQAGGVGDLALCNLLCSPTPNITGIEVSTMTRWSALPGMSAGAADEIYSGRPQLPPDLFFTPAGSTWSISCHFLNITANPRAYATAAFYEV